MANQPKARLNGTGETAGISGRAPRSRTVRLEERLARLFAFLSTARRQVVKLDVPEELRGDSRKCAQARCALAAQKAALSRVILLALEYASQVMDVDLSLTKAARAFVRRLRKRGVKVSFSSLQRYDFLFRTSGIKGLCTRYEGGLPSWSHEPDRILLRELWDLAGHRDPRAVYSYFVKVRRREGRSGAPLRFSAARAEMEKAAWDEDHPDRRTGGRSPARPRRRRSGIRCTERQEAVR